MEKNQIQYRPDRNRSRDSLSQYTVYARKSCGAWASNAHLLITSAGSDCLAVLTFFAIDINIDGHCHDDNTVGLSL